MAISYVTNSRAHRLLHTPVKAIPKSLSDGGKVSWKRDSNTVIQYLLQVEPYIFPLPSIVIMLKHRGTPEERRWDLWMKRKK